MTNERAIELLHHISDSQFDGIHGDERREALDMAVRALEGDGDTISRQATIIVIENSGLDDDSKDTVVRVLEQLPPAQPQRKRGHYIKGKNGEWYCSECRRIDDKYSVANFCWYCGARMDGESE